MTFYHRVFSLTFSLLVSLPLFAKELALTDEELAEQIFPEVNHLTASFGVTAYESGDSSHTIFINADKALYKAKEQGRNKVCS